MEISPLQTTPAGSKGIEPQPGAAEWAETVQVRRRKVGPVDEMFEALMALIDAAQGTPRDPEAAKRLVEETVIGQSQVIQQRVVG